MNQQRLDYLLAIYNYNTGLGRQYFDYRERFTATVFFAYAALVTALISLNFSLPCLAIAGTLWILSRFANFFLLKQYERSAYHFSRAHLVITQLDDEFGDDFRSITSILDAAKAKHTEQFQVKRNNKVRERILNSNTHDQWARLHEIFSYVAVLSGLAVVAKWIWENIGTISVFLGLD